MFILRNYQSSSAELQAFANIAELDAIAIGAADYRIAQAGDLLELYVKTDDNSPLMPLLKRARAYYLDDLDMVQTAPEVTALMAWLMDDHGVDYRGESLEATADRLGEIDIEADSNRYTDLIFHLKDAVERLYDLEMDEW
ncbi:hypothetical protein QKW35_20700 [Pontibacterium granulatum]|uniref:hypothetical protein n=1 Tax=Pontibacterium granulatum TaxID=2036029 RepID=UPI00249BBB78|nr:hypothetical protein [Pontibacterium granulatum]MDI3326804.1 hypothetical protein [Pontibacterium granulatum]